MSEASKLILFCTVLILLFRFFNPRFQLRLFITFSASLYVLFRMSDSPTFVILISAWAVGIYLLAFCLSRGLKSGSTWITLYVLAVIGLFSVLKMQWIGVRERNSLLDAALPLGFSFVMFQSIAFLHDVRANVIKLPHPLEFFSSILFFPTLFAGPWQRFQEHVKAPPEDPQGILFFQGFALFCLGIFKFSISGLILQVRLLPELPIKFDPSRNVLHPLTVMAFASLFLFANFSGFSDIVVGLSRMMGFDVRPNFRFPFLSTSVAEYWRRWHMSLGAWFAEYFYGPFAYRLSGRLNAKLAVAVAAFVTFVVIGFWHQYSMKFLIYAPVNAACAVFLFPRNRNKWWGIPVTFLIMAFLNTLFLTGTLSDYGTMVASIFSIREQWNLATNLTALLFLLTVSALMYFGERNLESILNSPQNVTSKTITIAVVFSCVFLFYGITVGSGRVASVYVGY